jgi:putative SOS response-associated peptidase YedK
MAEDRLPANRDRLQPSPGTFSPYAPLMCGRYTNTAGVEELNDGFGVPFSSAAGTRRFNIAPTEEVLAIVAPKRQPEVRLLRWGLIPWWSRDRKGAAKMINARVETVASSAAYRELIPKASRRALQVADGYFEWLKPERRSEPRQPFFFQVDGGVPFAFAALWTQARIEGQRVESVTLLTCDSAPNLLAASIHSRMPVILADRELQQAWLDPTLNTEDVLALCRALPADRLSAKAANPAVNKPGISEGPELLGAPGLRAGAPR